VPRTLKVLKDNGLRLLLVGFETQPASSTTSRKVRASTAPEFMRDCHRLGILVHGTFILGLPGETRETIETSIAFAKQIDRTARRSRWRLPTPAPSSIVRHRTTAGWRRRSRPTWCRIAASRKR
jgi:radical SAM superfamily enzyme YgiQ (UPF0313 family)